MECIYKERGSEKKKQKRFLLESVFILAKKETSKWYKISDAFKIRDSHNIWESTKLGIKKFQIHSDLM